MKPEKQKNIYSSNLMLIKLPSFQIMKAKNACYNSRISLTSLGVLDVRYPSFDNCACADDCVMTYKCDLLRA